MKDVAIALVADFKFLKIHFKRIFLEIRKIGNYQGPIIVLTTLLCPTFLIKFLNKKNNIVVLRFKKIKFSKFAENSLNNLETNFQPNRNKYKKFQWHKLHLFDEKIKNWEYIFYLDINMNIHFELESILNIRNSNSLMARADAYPSYDRSLSTQFDNTNNLYESLKNKYDLSIVNYFQTGVMYFDTAIIENSTKKEIFAIVENYPISTTNEQGILNLYFIFVNNKYEQLIQEIDGKLSYFYWLLPDKEVIISKAKSIKNK